MICHGLDVRRTELAYGSTVGYISGGGFYLWDLDGGRREFIPSKRNGFSCSAISARRDLLVLAEYGLKPNVYVFRLSSRELLFTLTGVSEYEIKLMEVSFNGKLLAVVRGDPIPEVVLWSLEERRELGGAESKLRISSAKDIRQLSFNPKQPTNFCLIDQSGFHSYHINSSYELSDQACSLKIMLRESGAIKGAFSYFQWDEVGCFYLAQGRNISYYDSETLEVKVQKQLQSDVLRMLLTQRHLVLFCAGGKVYWLNKYLKEMVQEEEEKLKVFYTDKTLTVEGAQFSFAYYNQSMKKIVMGTQAGALYTLPLEAEKSVLNEDEEPDNQNPPQGELKIPLDLKGVFHIGRVNFIREFASLPWLLSCSEDKICLFGLQEGKVFAHFDTRGEQITAADLNKSQNLLVVGTACGVLRAFDLTNPRKPLLIGAMRVFQSNKKRAINKVVFSPDGMLVALHSKESKKIYYVSTDPQRFFQMFGYNQLNYEVNDIAWNRGDKAPPFRLHALVYFMAILISVPDKRDDLRLKSDMLGRKIDPYMDHIVSLENGELLVTGQDKLLKRYRNPQENLSKMDLKTRQANAPPLEEVFGHDLPTASLYYDEAHRHIVTGGRDGSVILRDVANLGVEIFRRKQHNIVGGGVSAVFYSGANKLLATGGSDGSLQVEGERGVPGPGGAVKGGVKYELEELPWVQQQKIEHFQKILDLQHAESQKSLKNARRNHLNLMIENVTNKLRIILRENDEADELEKLPRDEFCVNIDSRNRILEAGKEQVGRLRQDVKLSNVRTELLATKIKARSWDKMKVQQRGLNGVKEHVLVFNYVLEQKEQGYQRRLRLVREFRLIEARERKARQEAGQPETLEAVEYIDPNSNYLVNGLNRRTPYVLVDYEKKEEVKEKDKKKGKKEEEKKETKKEEDKKEERKEEKEEGGDSAEWELIYPALQIYSNNRKRSQAILLRELQHRIMEQFNREFEKTSHMRQGVIELINDKNKRILELYQELKQPPELILPMPNHLEAPDSILRVDPSEIPFQRYLSREEREKQERERLKEMERKLALMQDDSGQRALKEMMGGTLEEKKENVFQQVVEKEPWMDKPPEEMSEDEKGRLREYQAKVRRMEEEKEKARKKYENDIRKLKQEIEEVMQGFDDKLFALFRRKLQYDYRLYEQELIIVKLSGSVYVKKEAEHRLVEYGRLLRQQVEESQRLELLREKLLELLGEQERKSKVKRGQFQRKDSKFMQIDAQIDQNLRVVDQEFDKKQNIKNSKLLLLDPFFVIQHQIYKAQRLALYSTIAEGVKKGLESSGGHVQDSNVEARFRLKRELTALDQSVSEMTVNRNLIDSKKEESNARKSQVEKLVERIKSSSERARANIQLLIRFKYGLVEIKNESAVPQLEDAVLLPEGIITSMNVVVNEKAAEKKAEMEAISSEKTREIQINRKLMEKTAQKNEISQKIIEVQLTKVTKEMQAALTKKKDRSSQENELKSIQEQMNNQKLEGERRIETFRKKNEKLQREIEALSRENEKLSLQLIGLNQTVEEREKIQDMRAGNVADETTEHINKFKQTALNRRLFDKAKKYTDEIELLREELTKLKARTFATFSQNTR